MAELDRALGARELAEWRAYNRIIADDRTRDGLKSAAAAGLADLKANRRV